MNFEATYQPQINFTTDHKASCCLILIQNYGVGKHSQSQETQRRIQVLGGGGGGGGARMVGVTGGGGCWLLARYEKRGGGAVGFWPDTKSREGCRFLARYEEWGERGGRGECCRFLALYENWGGGGEGCAVLSVSGPIQKVGGGGGCRYLARYEKWKGGGGAIGFWPDTKSVGGYDHVSRSPGYSTVVEFMRADINRRAAIIIKCCPKSYEFINGRGGGGGGARAPRTPPPLDPPLKHDTLLV